MDTPEKLSPEDQQLIDHIKRKSIEQAMYRQQIEIVFSLSDQ
ncbi:MAG: hypothetical protein ACPG7F_17830 [Aggregatilineales bacterium]